MKRKTSKAKATPIGWQSVQKDPLDVAAWQALLLAYEAHGQAWQAAYVASQLARLPGGAAALQAQAQYQPQGPAPQQAQGASALPYSAVEALLCGPALDNAPARVQELQAWLQTMPDDWLGWLFLLRLLDFLPQSEAQLHADAMSKTQALEYVPGESAYLLGRWRLRAGDAAAAAVVLSTLVPLQPVRHGAMGLLGEALLRVGHVQAAEQALTRASQSNNPATLAWLADVVYRHNYWQEAIALLERAAALQPDHIGHWLQLARVQSQTHALADCRRSLAQVRRIDPDNEEAHLLEIGLLGQLGDAKAYWQTLKDQLERQSQQPDGGRNSRLVSSVLMTALYQDHLPADEVAQQHQRLTAGLELVHATQGAAAWPAATGPARQRLRVGYVTGDLHRQHPVNLFMLPLLKQQKRSDLEVFIYHTGQMFDGYTAQAQACADVWVEAAHWDDQTLHQQIVRDGVDVLVDLAGHTSSHRLGVFVMRSAPVQASFLGYPHSTGLRCMDYLIGDRVVSPPEHAPLFSEQIARLQGPVFCWSPVDEYPLPTIQRSTQRVVFGCFNNALKLSPRTIALWSRILLAVPDAVLLLKAPSFASKEVCQRFAKRFASHGVDEGRLQFRGPSELSAMMQEYGDVDIALDPLAYNGGTTSLQCLWMGVPVVSLLGQSFQSRMGASFLTALGKTGWIAEDEAAYVRIAQRLAHEVHTLRTGRGVLRASMQASPLCRIEDYALDFERLLGEMSRKQLSFTR
jgi:predicted O-linked N-acetylglucosamine transferase (SPINDLY family)